MSNALAIAAVTATLRQLLDQTINSAIPGTTITTKPLDKARDNVTGNQLNLLLYQTLPNAAWRNQDLPRQVKPGEIAPPPLPLDLFYLLTAYGQNDDDLLAHQVLGRAMSVLHDHPLLGADEIQNALPNNDLHLQPERVRITVQPLSLEELSKLWAAFQTQYRISAAYQVALVLIESTRPARAALPVLTRGPGDAGVTAQADLTPPFPTLVSLALPNQQPAARLGDTLSVAGHHLTGDNLRLRFAHPRLAAPLIVPPPALISRSATQVTFRLPDTGDDPAVPANWPAGFYTLAAEIETAGQPTRTTNDLPFPVAPRLTGALPLAAVRDGQGDAAVTVTTSPEVRPDQRAALLVGDREVPAEPHPAPTGSLDFVVRAAQPGTFFVRLRIDGVDSLLVDRSVTPPVFDPSQRLTIT
jgi:hypothetical protein